MFREHYLGQASWEAQKRWVAPVLPLVASTRIMTLCPGGHGKSMLAIDFVTWLVVKNRYEKVFGAAIGCLNVVILSISEGLCVDWIRQIKEYLTSPKIVDDFGDFKSDKWAADAIIVKSPNKQARVDHPTVHAIGIKGQVFGRRAHFILADDVVDIDNSSTEAARRKLWTKFQEGPRAWLRPGGKIWIIGTRMHSRDLYAKTLDIGAYKCIVDRAIDWDTGEVLCPENPEYTLKYFTALKEEMTATPFNKRFMNVAVDEADNPFKEEFFEALYDHKRPFGLVDKHWRVYIGIDPAVGRGRGRSNIGLAAIGYDSREPSKRFLVDYVTEQLSPDRQADIAIRWYVDYNVSMIRIEKNACQLYLRDLIKERAQSFGVNPKIEMTFTGVNKWDIELGVDKVAAAFENGNFMIPYAESAKRKAEKFKNMLLESPPDKPIDIVMSMWFVEQHLQTLSRRRTRSIEINRPDYMQPVRIA